VDYPLYGLAEDRRFPRRELDDFWVAPAGDQDDAEPVAAVWLGHVTNDLRAGVRVGTFHRGRMDNGDNHRPVAGDPLSSVAHFGADSVAHLTLPDPADLVSDERTAELMTLSVSYAADQSSAYRTWPERQLTLDCAPVTARYWSFAGAWVAVPVPPPEVYVVVVGFGVPVESVRLTVVADGAEYGIVADGVLDRDWGRDRLEVRNREVHGTLLPRLNSTRFHADQLRLLGTQ
jgi:hypothetical protein